MAPSYADSSRSRNDRTAALSKPSRLTMQPHLAYLSRATTINATSHKSIQRSQMVTNSSISTHSRRAATHQRNDMSTSSTAVGNIMKGKKPANTTTSTIIVVHINNRLGRKAAIQCSPHDTIQTLKILAALQLGTRPETMMLKRQGQRALKNTLTLEDYEIGNGSSLDLEVDVTD